MAEKIYKFKIVPQQERFYNENSNWGVYTFITTSDDIPYFYDCYDDPFGDKPRLLNCIPWQLRKTAMMKRLF